MKRWIHSNTSIYGMSIARGKAKDKIEALGDIILEHVCKCILYGNSTGDYHHWIDGELANWLSIVNDITVKPGNKKLKVKDYDEMLLGGFGDDYTDARLNLNLLYTKFRQNSKPYPEVEINNELIQKFTDVTSEFHSIIPQLLSKDNKLSQEELAVELHQILDKYCL